MRLKKEKKKFAIEHYVETINNHWKLSRKKYFVKISVDKNNILGSVKV